MKRKLLIKLVGMDVDEAESLIKKSKHICYLVPENCRAISMQARPNTVILWQYDGKVISATAGDSLELKD